MDTRFRIHLCLYPIKYFLVSVLLSLYSCVCEYTHVDLLHGGWIVSYKMFVHSVVLLNSQGMLQDLPWKVQCLPFMPFFQVNQETQTLSYMNMLNE